jgi:hypothetical protein
MTVLAKSAEIRQLTYVGPVSKTQTHLGQNRNLGYRTRQDLKSSMFVLARANGNLTEGPTKSRSISY